MTTTITADTGAVSGSAGLKQSADSSGILALATGTGTTAVTIDASQNVGIGTSSPASGSGGGLSLGTTSAGKSIHLYSSSYAGNGLANFYGTDGAVKLQMGSSGATSAFVYGSAGVLQFGGNGSETMRIDSSGNLLVGTTSTSQSAGVGVKIFSSGNVWAVAASADNYSFYNSTAGAYRFYVSSAGTVFATNTTISAISDQRFKENIRDLDVGLDEIMALQPRLYDWKEGKGADIKNARGFIAQEFEEVFPDLIDEWKDPAPEGEEPYKSVRQDLIPVLVKAIQEQQALITTLTERISALEAK